MKSRLRISQNPQRAIFFLLYLILGAHQCLYGGSATKKIRAFRSATAINVDGILDEAAWQQAEVISDFIQQEPDVNEPATERTEVRVVLAGEALYFGVICFDSEPERIIGRERRRDNGFRDDDRFEIVIDTFHDHRNAFNFVTNPLAARFDALITDEGADVNRNWDERWWVEAKITDSGWTLEIEIPLSTLRAPSEASQWGINFRRFIRRKNERVLWTAWDRDFSFFQVSQAGHLEGMEGVKTGLRARIQPYLLGGFRYTGLPDGTSRWENTSDVGLEVAKFGITPSLMAEVTANTDFAQVEVDAAVVNLTRFPLFFPEKREFFLERAGIFEFGLGGRRGGGVQRGLQMYFSRRIGLTEDRRPRPVLGGVKLTGRLRNLDLGLLNVQTDRLEGLPGSNYTVVRLKRNILARSNIGTFFSNRQSGEVDDANRVAAAEANFTLFKNLRIQGFIGRSFTSGVEGDQNVGRAKFNWFSDLYEVFAEHLYIGEEFRHDIGFVRRSGIRRNNGIFVWEPRPGVLNIRNFVFRNEIVYLTDTDNRLLTREHTFQNTTRFQSDDVLRFATTNEFEQLEEDFEITPGIFIPLDVYRFRSYWVEYESSPRRLFSSSQSFTWGDFFGGTRRALVITPTFKPRPEFSAEWSYEYNDIDLPQGDFTTHVINSRFNFNFTNRWLTTFLAQYDSESERLVFFFRLRFIYQPGDDLFIVYNQTSAVGGGPDETDRALTIKFTHSFDF